MSKTATPPQISLTDPEGNTYTGDFEENGKLDGYGTLKDSKGNIIYEGFCKDGKPDGEGTLKDYEVNITYRGYFKNGKFDGEGAIENSQGNILKGNFESGEFIEGSIISRDGKTLFLKNTEEKPLKEKYGRCLVVAGDDFPSKKWFDTNAHTIISHENPSTESINIAEHICPRKSGEKSQLRIFISAHGSKAGTMAEKDHDLVEKTLRELCSKIVTHNKSATKEHPINRIKLTLDSCYGDLVIVNSLLPLIKIFVDNGIEVRTSASKETSTFTFFNGKNAIPTNGKNDKLNITERFFSNDREAAESFLGEKHYENLKLTKASQNLRLREESTSFFGKLKQLFYYWLNYWNDEPDDALDPTPDTENAIFCASGDKVYDNSEDFFRDNYQGSENKTNSTAEASTAEASTAEASSAEASTSPPENREKTIKQNPIYESDDEDEKTPDPDPTSATTSPLKETTNTTIKHLNSKFT